MEPPVPQQARQFVRKYAEEYCLGLPEACHCAACSGSTSRELIAPAVIKTKSGPVDILPSVYMDHVLPLRVLGEGASSEVFLCEVPGFGEAAVKITKDYATMKPVLVRDEGRIAEMTRECELLASLHHPCVSPILATLRVSKQDQSIIGHVAHIAKGSLEDYLSHCQRMAPDGQASILLDVAEGMHYLHKAGIAHCKLQPQNILWYHLDHPMTETVEYWAVADLGAAVPIEDLKKRKETGGSRYWWAPEQWAGKGGLTEKVDVYTFGLTMWHVLTGRPHYPTEWSDAKIAEELQNGYQITAPQGCLSSDLAIIMLACTQRDPLARPSFGDICPILRAIMEKGDSPSAPVPQGETEGGTQSAGGKGRESIAVQCTPEKKGGEQQFMEEEEEEEEEDEWISEYDLDDMEERAAREKEEEEATRKEGASTAEERRAEAAGLVVGASVEGGENIRIPEKGDGLLPVEGGERPVGVGEGSRALERGERPSTPERGVRPTIFPGSSLLAERWWGPSPSAFPKARVHHREASTTHNRPPPYDPRSAWARQRAASAWGL